MADDAPAKVVLIGLDAADADFIRTHGARLPTLRRLFEAGVHPLASPADLLTSAVWPSFATGESPGHHGVHYPMQWDPAQMTLRRVDNDWLGFEPFWYDLARRGHRVTILDVPFSHPSRLPAEAGVEVLNWGSQERLDRFHANRADVTREIQRRFGRHPMGGDVPIQETPDRLARIRDRLVAGAAVKARVARWLYETTAPDLFVTVFAEPHRAGHLLWPDFGGRDTGVPCDALLDVYRALDGALDHLLEAIDPRTTAIAVFSTHGFGPNHTQEHFVLPVMERINRTFRGEPLADDATPPTGGNLMQKLRAAVPQRLQFHIAQLLPHGVRDGVMRGAFLGGLDWAKTPGFALIASGEAYLRFNLVGREREGMLAPGSAEFRRYADHLERCLCGLRCADTGRPVVREVVDAAERWPGPRAHLLPDRVVLWADVLPSRRLESAELGSFTGELATGRIGEHRPNGFVTFQGATAGLATAGPIERVEDLSRVATALLAAP